jgi:hypothetical protein
LAVVLTVSLVTIVVVLLGMYFFYRKAIDDVSIPVHTVGKNFIYFYCIYILISTMFTLF